MKARTDSSEPEDILDVSRIVKALRDEKRIQRVYARGPDETAELEKILDEVNK